MVTRWRRIGGGVIATAVLTVGMWWCLDPEAGLGRWLARSWARGLSHRSAEQVAGDLRYIAALDEAGLDTLLDALGSPRTVVSESAAKALHERLDVWRQWPDERSGALAEKLAQGLSQRMGGWPAASQRVAADVALQLLDWPLDVPRARRAGLLVNCERILRSVPSGPTASRSAPPVEGKANPADAKSPGDQPGILPTLSESEEMPDSPPSSTIRITDVAAGPDFQPAVTQQTDTSPAISNVDSPMQRPAATDESMQESEVGPDSTAATPSVDATASDAAAEDLHDELSKLPDLDLIQLLGSTDPDVEREAREVLQRRGFQKYEFTLAEKLIHPDPAERRQVAQGVHGLRSGAGRWLIWLSQDPDQSVRQAAVSLMVTAQDPAVQRRLLKMEVTDGDEAICERIRVWRERR